MAIFPNFSSSLKFFDEKPVSRIIASSLFQATFPYIHADLCEFRDMVFRFEKNLKFACLCCRKVIEWKYEWQWWVIEAKLPFFKVFKRSIFPAAVSCTIDSGLCVPAFGRNAFQEDNVMWSARSEPDFRGVWKLFWRRPWIPVRFCVVFKATKFWLIFHPAAYIAPPSFGNIISGFGERKFL